MARTATLWLATPGRFAAIGKPRARIVIGLLVLLLLACLLALTAPTPAAVATGPASSQSEQTDLMVYEKIIAGVRGGGDYYTVATDTLRAGGYPLRPFFTVRMPSLAVVQAALPVWGPEILLWLLAAYVGLIWMLRLSEALPRLLPRVAALVLLAGSLLAFFQADLAPFHEIWAGLLIALSLGLRRPGRWLEPVAFGLVAMLIRETAVLYALVMLALAWREGERREALGWLAALALFAAALAAHAWAVTGVTGPHDPASPGWHGLLGFGFFVKALTLATALQLLPTAAAALIVGLALFGWAAWNDPLGLRMVATLAAYAALIAIFARSDTFYWGLMVAPVFLAGLVFVPDGLRDLFRPALDRRRITVTRVAR
ncbi:hypothetical protein FHS95_000944 [Sphingomonas naasensis]|uniref:DUF2029 domain-containing protein n=1 Tax=Sphingomonas naasensis TaxID=1344951 RepID=A0A4S1WSS9_9SPHN|nr:hypothetical protein [Sphingomonas naasensis]NIJ19275.1 hypothetical protein [Sphingomonas naasensis]TGX46451.1 hypothetical protein E5A74_04710 [Sphingomonas naasensis]